MTVVMAESLTRYAWATVAYSRIDTSPAWLELAACHSVPKESV